MNSQKIQNFKKPLTTLVLRVYFLITGLLISAPNIGLCEENHLSNRWGRIQAPSLSSQKTIPLLSPSELTLLKPISNSISSYDFNTAIRVYSNIAFLNKDAFAAPPPPRVDPGVPRIAILLPLTGQHKKLGQAMLNAAQLALFHFADIRFELLPQDTRGTERGALDAVAAAIGNDASLILGPLFASSVAAVAPSARAAGVKVIAFSNNERVAGDGVFTMGFLPREQVRRVVNHAIIQGRRRFAVLAPNNDYGYTIVNALTEVLDENGGDVTEQAFYDPQVSDLGPVIKSLANYDERRQSLLDERRLLEARDDDAAKFALKKLENLETKGDVSFEALLIADGGKTLQAIAALLPYYDIDPKKIKMLGTGHWDLPGIGSEPALVGGWFAAPAPDGRREFEKQYNTIFGAVAPRLATLAYDATALAAVFAQTNQKTVNQIPRLIYKLAPLVAPQGFKGLDGVFRFTTAGFVERALSVFQVGERKNKIISQAPQMFTTDFN
jgi:branched-chain amino acid transport system substrate-binding protein